MTSKIGLNAFNLLPMTPLKWGVAAGAVTGIAQYAAHSFFRTPDRLIPLIRHIEQWPGGRALVNFAPAIAVGLVIGIAMQRLNQSIKLPPKIDRIFYTPLYRDVENALQQVKRGEVATYGSYGLEAQFCINHPDAGNVRFDNALGYANNAQIQIVAIAGGSVPRGMISAFFAYPFPDHQGASAETAVNQAAKKVEEQTKDEKTKQTFLGGAIFQATNGKRYFFGVNCGDSKLYCLREGSFMELTQENRNGKVNSTFQTFSTEVKSGDQLFFMTSSIHNNLNLDPPTQKYSIEPQMPDANKLSTLNKLTQHKATPIETVIMNVALNYTRPRYVEALGPLNLAALRSNEKHPGTLGSMTLLSVTVK